MTKNDLKALGLSEADVLTKLVDKLCDQLLDESGDNYRSEFEDKLRKAVIERVDAKLAAAIKTHIAPKVSELIDGICLQETNKWGEERGEKLTFTEYLVLRADAYMREPVSYDGKTKGESGGYFNAMGTRVQHMINDHLKYHVSTAMESAMKNATTSISKGLKEAAEIAINNIKVTVDTKVTSR